MLDEAVTTRLREWFAQRLGEPNLVLQSFEPMSGGSIQENWRVRCGFPDLEKTSEFVLRKDAPATIASSLTRRDEYRILEVAHQAGVLTPPPIGFCEDSAVLGAPFAVMGLVEGVGLGPRIAKDLTLGGDRVELARRLGKELAKIHSVQPPRSALDFLGTPPTNPALMEVQSLRSTLDAIGEQRPAIEWGLRWAELHAPTPAAVTLVHRDFRTGNYMVDACGLTGVLDWEFAAWAIRCSTSVGSVLNVGVSAGLNSRPAASHRALRSTKAIGLRAACRSTMRLCDIGK
jgi:aminoglycoside phosphotransferase (APT) family kinase protein